MKIINTILLTFIVFLFSSFSVFSQNNVTPYIKVTSPNGGEKWEANTTQTITWQSNGITNVKIEYSLSRGMMWYSIVSSVDASAGQYKWNIPNIQIAEVLIKVSDISNPSIFDISDKSFSIIFQSKINKYQNKQRTVQSGTPIKIMPLGDSITEGDGEDQSGTPLSPSAYVGYRAELWHLLYTAGYNFTFVGTQNSGSSPYSGEGFVNNHEGHGGMEVGPPSYNSLPTMLDNIDGYLQTLQSSSSTPDIILFHMGTNDIDYLPADNTYRIAKQLYQVCTGHILMQDATHYGNPNAEIFLAQIIANYYDYANTTALFDSTTILNTDIGNDYNNTSILPSAQKNNVQLVNMQSSPDLVWQTDFSTGEGTGSGDYNVLHPKPSGYTKMAQHWFNAMQAYYQPTLAGPADGAPSQSVDVTLSWNTPQAVTNNSSLTYELQVSSSSDFSSTFYDNSNISSSTNSVSNLHLSYATQYYWRVRITNYGWSAVRSFTTTPLYVNASIILQGPFISPTSPYMNTMLNSSGYLQSYAASQPYSGSYAGTESVGSGFFAAHPTIVDWVLLQLRTGTGAATIVGQRAAFLKSDGTIVDLDGSSNVNFSGTVYGTANGVQYAASYYIVIKHRNHLAVISNTAATLSGGNTLTYDFTGGGAYGTNAMANLGGGKYGMWAGDADGNGQIQNSDKNSYWQVQVGLSGYQSADFNLNGQVQNNDKNSYWSVNVGLGTQVP